MFLQDFRHQERRLESDNFRDIFYQFELFLLLNGRGKTSHLWGLLYSYIEEFVFWCSLGFLQNLVVCGKLLLMTRWRMEKFFNDRFPVYAVVNSVLKHDED